MSKSKKHRQRRISRFFSLVLRHQPEMIGLQLDEAGWASVECLLHGCAQNGHSLSEAELKEIVASNDKQRFEFNETETMIRARQGHSVEVELGYPLVAPPVFLFHGTPEKFVASILAEGLKPMQRHHVHLHEEASLANTVGSRRGKPVVLRIRASEMAQSGQLFYKTDNNVWVTDRVPPEFIDSD